MNHEAVNSLVLSFAKENKISKAKANDFAMALLASCKNGNNAGRKAKESTLVLRERIKQYAITKTNTDGYTSKALAQELGASLTDVNNAFRFLGWKQCGTMPQEKGKRGKPLSIWMPGE